MSSSAETPVAVPATGRLDRPTGRTLASVALAVTMALATGAGWLSLSISPLVDPVVIITIWLNMLILLIAIAVEARRRPYSLNLMHLLALFLFLGAPALFQYSQGRFPLAGPISGMRGHVLPSLIAVQLWILGYVAGYEVTRRSAPRARGAVLRFLERPLLPGRTTMVLLFAILSVVYLGILGLAGAVTRMSANEAIAEADIVQQGELGLIPVLLHGMLLRAFSVVALLGGVLLLMRERSVRNPVFLLILFVLACGTLLANNPFAASRLWFATSIIAFTAVFLLRRLRTGWGLVAIAVAGLTIVPGLNESRYSETFDELADYLVLVSPVDYLATSSDVDSLGMFALCHQWTERFGFTYGAQEIGAVLFWVPRVIWPGKPVSTGPMVTEDLGFDFTNLSPPIMAETYVDFGFFGVPFVAAFVGFVLARLDRGYWERPPGEARVRAIDAIYPLWLGCVVFLTRGGLISALWFTFSFTAWIAPFTVGLTRSKRVAAARREHAVGGQVGQPGAGR